MSIYRAFVVEVDRYSFFVALTLRMFDSKKKTKRFQVSPMTKQKEIRVKPKFWRKSFCSSLLSKNRQTDREDYMEIFNQKKREIFSSILLHACMKFTFFNRIHNISLINTTRV